MLHFPTQSIDPRAEARENFLKLVEADDARVASIPSTAPTIVWHTTANPWLGGDYYRATRAAMLSAAIFGWHTAVTNRVCDVDGDGRVGFLTADALSRPVIPDVIILRPCLGWTNELTEQARSAGQMVIADLDDDLWNNPAWEDSARPNDDGYDDWYWHVGSYLFSTQTLADSVLDRGRERELKNPNYRVAPNLWPSCIERAHPGRALGTRLWISGRDPRDMQIYRDAFAPTVKASGRKFVHIGGGDGRTFEEFGFPSDQLVTYGDCPLALLPSHLSMFVSIGCLAVGDSAYNRAKTLTHPVELASVGIPLVLASDCPIYAKVPGLVDPTPRAVGERVRDLLDDDYWLAESSKALAWATDQAIRAEREYLTAVRDFIVLR